MCRIDADYGLYLLLYLVEVFHICEVYLDLRCRLLLMYDVFRSWAGDICFARCGRSLLFLLTAATTTTMCALQSIRLQQPQ